MSHYIMTKDPEVRARIIKEHHEYNESLRKPIDWDDPQVKKNMADYTARFNKMREEYIAKHGIEAWKRSMNPDIHSPNEDYTSTFEYLDDKRHQSFHSYLEDMWAEEMWEDRHGNLQPKPLHIQDESMEEEEVERPMTRREKFKFRPCLGCPDCRHWDVWKCECTNPNPKPEICDWISERYREKGE